MNLINYDLPRLALIMNVGVAALAAIGTTSLSGGQGQAVVAIPVLTALLSFALLAWAQAPDRPVRSSADAAMLDPLTGLATVDVGEEALAREFAAAQRGRPLTVVLVRLEGLPRYRARHGKTVADQLLRVVGRTLGRHRRGMHSPLCTGSARERSSPSSPPPTGEVRPSTPLACAGSSCGSPRSPSTTE